MAAQAGLVEIVDTLHQIVIDGCGEAVMEYIRIILRVTRNLHLPAQTHSPSIS